MASLERSPIPKTDALMRIFSMFNINRWSLGFAVLVALPLALSAAAQANAGNVSVQVDGLRNRKGQVCLSIFNSSRGFPGDGGFKSQCAAIEDSTVTVTFSGIKSGSYAIAVLHDENSDGKANRNRLGIPTEGFGFSRNPGLRAGPPKFGDAAFVAAGGSTAVQVQMRYLF
jgi:uncharacterized protein (DUF2141 family)